MRADATTGLGLRARIAFALVVGFALSSILLAFAVVSLSERASRLEVRRSVERTASSLAEAERWRPGAASELLEVWRRARVVAWGEVAVLGSEGAMLDDLRDEAGGRGRRAPAGLVVGVARARTPDGGRIEVAVGQPPALGTARRLAPLLVLYVLVTGVGILALTISALGGIVVRPLERLTRAAESLADGKPHQTLPVEGAAELARLAAAFNAMAEQIRADAAQRESRVAELERTTRELRAAQEAVVRSEKLASVGRLSAGLAHEIGNPLAAVLGLVELLLQGGLDADEQRAFLTRIEKETRRIHRILRDLLDFARRAPTSGRDAGETADLTAVVADAVKLVAPQKDLRRVTLEQRLPESGARVRGSHDKLVQVVLNLLLNAADAVEGDGAITIEVAGVSVASETNDGDPHVVLTVRDTGPGIAPEIAGRLFEPFATTKPAGRGTGLGLAVCATIVESYGGRIEARNLPEGGAEFEVRLPAA